MVVSYSVPNANRAFALGAVTNGTIRADGRLPEAWRATTINCSETQAGVAEVRIGETVALCCVSATSVPAAHIKSTRGLLRTSVVLSSAASEDVSGSAGAPMLSAAAMKKNPVVVEAARVLAMALKETEALDLEGLCIRGGVRVWRLDVAVTVLCDDGNVMDAVVLSALAALSSFQLPESRPEGTGALEVLGTDPNYTIFEPEVRNPRGLGLHHLPCAVTFGVLPTGEAVFSDPSHLEEEVQDGTITVLVNAQGVLCAVLKNGGAAVLPGILGGCISEAAERAKGLSAQILEAAEEVTKARAVALATGQNTIVASLRI